MIYTKGCSIFQYGGDYGCYGEYENCYRNYRRNDDYDDDLGSYDLKESLKEFLDD